MNSAPIRILLMIAAAGTLVGLAAIFAWVPTDCSRVINGACFEGTVQRIFYVHVPSAWIAYLAYTVVLIASIAFLRTGSSRWDTMAHSSAEVGVLFTAVTLGTGMVWGKSVWGIYWTWDARLTLTFVLFLIYVGYLAFRAMSTDQGHGSRIAAVIGIAGFAVVPLVHFSVQWWRGQHPDPVVVTPGEASDLPAEMLITMLFMLAMFTVIYSLLLVLRVRLGETARSIGALEAP